MIRKTFQCFSKLKAILTEQVPAKRKEFAELKKTYGEKVYAQVKVEQILGGMRDIPAIYYEGSQLDAQTGIKFRGFTIP